MKPWHEIDLSKAHGHDHPDIKTDGTFYLVKFYGNWFLGPFCRVGYGLTFPRWGTSGCQFDAPGFNGSTWERVIEINPDLLSIEKDPGALTQALSVLRSIEYKARQIPIQSSPGLTLNYLRSTLALIQDQASKAVHTLSGGDKSNEIY